MLDSEPYLNSCSKAINTRDIFEKKIKNKRMNYCNNIDCLCIIAHRSIETDIYLRFIVQTKRLWINNLYTSDFNWLISVLWVLDSEC